MVVEEPALGDGTRTMNGNGSILRRLDESGIPLLLARIILGAMFLWMGFAKLEDPVKFLKLIRMYHMLPESPPIFLNATAVVLPVLEVLCGAAILAGLYLRGAGALMVLMLGVFTQAIFFRAWRIHSTECTPFFDIQFDCGCGAGVVVIWKKLLENTGLFLLALYTVISGSRRFCMDLWFVRRRPMATHCHLCGYAVEQAKAGLCEKCATPPELSAEAQGN